MSNQSEKPSAPILYVGVHKAHMAKRLPRVMISMNVLERRKSDFEVGRWILDSGAFTRIASGRGHMPISEYAGHIRRWARVGRLDAAVCQDWMCEPFITELTGLTVVEHQSRTTANYLELRSHDTGAYIMPVVQGYQPDDYADHTAQLSPHLSDGAWVGLGSVCKRQGRPSAISAVLTAVLRVRPDLRLHGFGVKKTALRSLDVSSRLYSVDSMAWSFAGRRIGRGNDITYALEWASDLQAVIPQESQMAMG